MPAVITVDKLTNSYGSLLAVDEVSFVVEEGEIFLAGVILVSLSLLSVGFVLASPLTHAVALLRGPWTGEGWADHGIAVVALVAGLAVCTTLSSRIFRGEQAQKGRSPGA